MIIPQKLITARNKKVNRKVKLFNKYRHSEMWWWLASDLVDDDVAQAKRYLKEIGKLDE